jgi:hypothetical protein
MGAQCLEVCPSGYYSNLDLRKCTGLSTIYAHYKFESLLDVVPDEQGNYDAEIDSILKPIPVYKRGFYFDNSLVKIKSVPKFLFSNVNALEMWISPRGTRSDSVVFAINSSTSTKLALKIVDFTLQITYQDANILEADLGAYSTAYPSTWAYVYYYLKSTSLTDAEAGLFSNYGGLVTTSIPFKYSIYNSLSHSFTIGGLPTSASYRGFIYDMKLYTYAELNSPSRYSSSCAGCSVCPGSSCIPTCEYNEWLDNAQCTPCPDAAHSCLDSVRTSLCVVKNCSKCSTFEAGCTTCASNLIVKPDGSCGCRPDTFLDEAVCKDCSLNCWACYSNYVCLICDAGFFKDSETQACQACSSNCFRCTSRTACVECRYPYTLTEGGCIIAGPPTPPPDFNSTDVDTSNIADPNCPVLCTKCTQAFCTACVSSAVKSKGLCVCAGSAVYANGSCRSCDSNQYAFKGKCLDCSSSCMTCSSADVCTSCREGTRLLGSKCRAVQCPTPDDCTFCDDKCSGCDFNGCLDCLAGALQVGDSCVCMDGYADEDGVCTQAIDLTADLSLNAISVVFPDPLTDLEISASDFAVQQDTLVVAYTLLPSDVLGQVSLVLSYNATTTTDFKVTLIPFKYTANLVQYSRQTQSVTLDVTPTETLETQSESTTKQVTAMSSGVATAGLAAASLAGGSVVSMMFTLNFLSMMSYIPMVNVDIPPVVKGNLKGSNQASYFQTLMLMSVRGHEEWPEAFTRAKAFGFKTGLFLINIMGNLLMICILILLTIFLCFTSSIQKLKKPSVKVLDMLRTKAAGNYTILTFVEYLLPAAVQLRTLSYHNPLEAFSSLIALTMYVAMIVLSLYLILFGLYHEDKIVQKDPKFMEFWSFMYAKYRPVRSCYSYIPILLLQRAVIVSVIVFVDAGKYQCAVIFFIVLAVTFTQKFMYVVLKRPQIAKGEWLLTITFDFAELVITGLTGLSSVLTSTTFNSAFEIICLSIMSLVQAFSFAIVMIDLTNKVKECRRKKAEAKQLADAALVDVSAKKTDDTRIQVSHYEEDESAVQLTNQRHDITMQPASDRSRLVYASLIPPTKQE